MIRSIAHNFTCRASTTFFTAMAMLVDKTLRSHPLSNNIVDLLRLLPQQPVRSVNVLHRQVRDIRAHLGNNLVSDNTVAQSPDKQCRTLDVETAFDAQKRLVGLVVGRAVSVVVA